MSWENIDWTLVFAALFVLEQALTETKLIKANSTLQLICSIIEAIAKSKGVNK